jgi:hypothetical protein
MESSLFCLICRLVSIDVSSHLTPPLERSLVLPRHQSNNFFAALDDSGDEAPPKKSVTVTAPKDAKDGKPKVQKKVVVEPSKVDETYVSWLSLCARD